MVMSDQSPERKNPRVFMSYSWDNKEHKQWVLKLSKDLNAVGIHVVLDQWDLRLGQDQVAWMAREIGDSDRVILVCSDEYVAKANEQKGGVGFEGSVISGDLITNVDTFKFIPLLRANESDAIPKYLGARIHVDFRNDHDYSEKLEELTRDIKNLSTRPPLGESAFADRNTQSWENRNLRRRFTDTDSFANFANSDEWFIQQSARAKEGMKRSGLSGYMEMRFAPSTPLNQMQTKLLNAAKNAQIMAFGWPIGLVFEDEFKPQPTSSGIFAEVLGYERGRKSYDYWALNRTGDFYSIITLFEDTVTENTIFFDTRMVRTAELLLYCGRLYTNLGVASGETVGVELAHVGLAGRELEAANPSLPSYAFTSIENEHRAQIVMTFDQITKNLSSNVKQLLSTLFILFQFSEFTDERYDHIVKGFASQIP